MKKCKIIYLVIIAFIFAGCEESYYSEGSIKTVDVTNVTMQSAVINGRLEFSVTGGNAKIVRRGFVFGTSENELTAVKGDFSGGMVYDAIGNEGNFSGNVSALLPNTQYVAKAFFVLVQTDTKGRVIYDYEKRKLIYLRDGIRYDAYYDNEKGMVVYDHDDYDDPDYYTGDSYNVLVFYGNTVEFMTADGVLTPTITTLAASNITATGARLNGNISFAGYPDYSERGFVYGEHINPTVDNAIKRVVTGSGTGNFHVDITALTVNRLYYARAYAINKGGNREEVTYGEQITLTPSALTPLVTTLTPTNVTANTATLIGKIDYQGDPPLTERGFVYSNTFPNPSVDDDPSATRKHIVGGTGTDFSANIAGLSTGATYYVRAYAINSGGTAYGESVSFRPGGHPDIVILDDLGIAVQKTDISTSSTWSAANTLCQGSRVGGYSDWRLPTIGELANLYARRDEIGGFLSNGTYWSGTLLGSTGYYTYYYVFIFSNGSQSDRSTSTSLRVRAVRNLP